MTLKVPNFSHSLQTHLFLLVLKCVFARRLRRHPSPMTIVIVPTAALEKCEEQPACFRWMTVDCIAALQLSSWIFFAEFDLTASPESNELWQLCNVLYRYVQYDGLLLNDSQSCKEELDCHFSHSIEFLQGSSSYKKLILLKEPRARTCSDANACCNRRHESNSKLQNNKQSKALALRLVQSCEQTLWQRWDISSRGCLGKDDRRGTQDRRSSSWDVSRRVFPTSEQHTQVLKQLCPSFHFFEDRVERGVLFVSCEAGEKLARLLNTCWSRANARTLCRQACVVSNAIPSSKEKLLKCSDVRAETEPNWMVDTKRG